LRARYPGTTRRWKRWIPNPARPKNGLPIGPWRSTAALAGFPSISIPRSPRPTKHRCSARSRSDPPHLRDGGSSLDAVTEVDRTLEDDALFNAGIGAVFTHEGSHELDAAVMDGRSLACGAVAGVSTVSQPGSAGAAGHGEDPLRFPRGSRRRSLRTSPKACSRSILRCSIRRDDGDNWRKRGPHTEQWDRGLRGARSARSSRRGHIDRGTYQQALGTDWRLRRSSAPGTYASDASCAVSCTGRA
jgi:beta-aspartyl-peptidase (threonine type)